ncbi:MAG: sulfatase [Planctomycetota bacterium]
MIGPRLLLLTLALAPGPAQEDARAPRRPNVVFIYADDHAERAVGACGSPLTRTPHIDRLAAEGMRFRESFVGNSICGPARATVLTGLHSHANGKMTNGGGFRRELPTFAKHLQGAGYQTAMVGKWHLSGNPEGFDHWAIANGGYYNPAFVTAEGRERREGYTTEVIADEALRWIDEERDAERPFLVWINHAATHRTWRPGPDYLTSYDDRELPEPASLFDDYAGRSKAAADAQMRIARDLFPAYDLKLPSTGDGILDGRADQMLDGMTPAQREAWDAAYGPKNEAFLAANPEGDALVRWKYQRYIRDYLRCVDAVDDSVGRVLAYLEENGLSDDTVVVYSSDQGFFLGEHGWYDKRWMYEPSLRTPLIVRWPGVTEPGSVCDRMVQNIDMAPTLLDVAGADADPAMHGRSLVPLLAGDEPDGWRDAVYYHYHQQDSGRTSHTVGRHYGVRTARYKLLHLYDYGDWELYDLQADPDELDNRVDDGELQPVVAELKAKLRELRKRYADETGAPL